MNKKFTISFDNTTIAFNTKSTRELLTIRWIFEIMNSEMFTKIGIFLIKFGLQLRFPIKFILKPTVFRQFCGGENLEECLKVSQNLMNFNILVIPDFSVEAQKTESAFLKAKNEIQKSIAWVQLHASNSFAVFKCSAIVDPILLQKVQNKEDLDVSQQAEFDAFVIRFFDLCQYAYDKKVKLLIDAEESWIQNVIDELALQAMQKFNHRTAIIFNTVQMYRVDKLGHLQDYYEMALTNGFYLGIKLVRGAYLEKENNYALKNGLLSKIHVNKSETDRAYNAALAFCTINIPFIFLCAGSHNEKSNVLLVDLLAEVGAEFKKHVYFAQLYGMGDHISFTLASAGYHTAKYLPYGPVNKVLPYLFRRAEENKSMNGQSSKELVMIKNEIKRRKSFL